MSKKENEMKALKWRLSERPSVENISKLHELGLLSKEEARQIILDEVEVDIVTIEDLQSELKLLRKMVLELSEREPDTIVKIIEKEVERLPYKTQPYWFDDFNKFYCTSTGNTTLSVAGWTNGTA